MLTEARHRLRQLAHFFVAPRVLVICFILCFAWYSSLVQANIFATQRYTAEINIVPQLTFADYEQVHKQTSKHLQHISQQQTTNNNLRF
jgi:Na+/H+ antiporter NhaC